MNTRNVFPSYFIGAGLLTGAGLWAFIRWPLGSDAIQRATAAGSPRQGIEIAKKNRRQFCEKPKFLRIQTRLGLGSIWELEMGGAGMKKRSVLWAII